MLDFNLAELMVVAVVALLVIGPKDLPKAMRFVGHWVGKARGVARQFRSGFDAMVREAELEEMEKKWKAENERIMREHPPEPSQVAALPSPAANGEAPPVMTAEPLIHADDAPATDPPVADPVSPTSSPDVSSGEALPDRKPEA